MSPDELKTAVSEAVTSAMSAQMKDFYIEREEHYKDHQFIQDLRKLCDSCKGTAVAVVVKGIVGACLFLMMAGVYVWTKGGSK